MLRTGCYHNFIGPVFGPDATTLHLYRFFGVLNPNLMSVFYQGLTLDPLRAPKNHLGTLKNPVQY